MASLAVHLVVDTGTTLTMPSDATGRSESEPLTLTLIGWQELERASVAAASIAVDMEGSAVYTSINIYVVVETRSWECCLMISVDQRGRKASGTPYSTARPDI